MQRRKTELKLATLNIDYSMESTKTPEKRTKLTPVGTFVRSVRTPTVDYLSRIKPRRPILSEESAESVKEKHELIELDRSMEPVRREIASANALLLFGIGDLHKIIQSVAHLLVHSKESKLEVLKEVHRSERKVLRCFKEISVYFNEITKENSQNQSKELAELNKENERLKSQVSCHEQALMDLKLTHRINMNKIERKNRVLVIEKLKIEEERDYFKNLNSTAVLKERINELEEKVHEKDTSLEITRTQTEKKQHKQSIIISKLQLNIGNLKEKFNNLIQKRPFLKRRTKSYSSDNILPFK